MTGATQAFLLRGRQALGPTGTEQVNLLGDDGLGHSFSVVLPAAAAAGVLAPPEQVAINLQVGIAGTPPTAPAGGAAIQTNLRSRMAPGSASAPGFPGGGGAPDAIVLQGDDGHGTPFSLVMAGADVGADLVPPAVVDLTIAPA